MGRGAEGRDRIWSCHNSELPMTVIGGLPPPLEVEGGEEENTEEGKGHICLEMIA